MMNQGFEILDFHTHPFNQDKFNVCSYFKNYEMGEADMKKTLEPLGISRIAGSVIWCRTPFDSFDMVRNATIPHWRLPKDLTDFTFPASTFTRVTLTSRYPRLKEWLPRAFV